METSQSYVSNSEFKVLENGEFRVLRKEEYPEGLDNLSRDSFSWLSYWSQGMRPDGYGYAYKVGFKDKVKDAKGNPKDLRIIFFNLVAKPEIDIEPSKLEEVAQQAKTVFNHINRQVHDNDNHFCVLTKPLDYMMSDFDETVTHSRMIKES